MSRPEENIPSNNDCLHIIWQYLFGLITGLGCLVFRLWRIRFRFSFSGSASTTNNDNNKEVSTIKTPVEKPLKSSPICEARYAGQLAMNWTKIYMESSPKYSAVLVATGIDRYGKQPLSGCATDAMKLSDRFGETYQTSGLVFPLVNEIATIPNLVLSLRIAVNGLAAGGILWYFHSGHGVTAVRHGTPEGRQEGLLLADGVLSDRAFASLIAKIVPANVLLVVALDSCYSHGMKEVAERPNTILLASSDKDATSLTAAPLKAGGYLSAALIEAFAGAADKNRDGRLTLGELRSYIEEVYARHCPRNMARDVTGALVDQHCQIERTVPLGTTVFARHHG